MNQDKIIAQLDTELTQIAERLAQSLQELEGPLGELVRPQLQYIQPFTRAGVVLTTSYCMESYTELLAEESDARPVPTARVQALAAAVEMLYLAQTIHRRLIRAGATETGGTTGSTSCADTLRDPAFDTADQQTDAHTVDKTFLGSTILAGDYCFSRASQLAAETENPQVVAHFAQTLQAISEGLLREEFEQRKQEAGASQNDGQPQRESFDEHRLLLLAGAEAALILHGVPIETPFFERAPQRLSPGLTSPNVASSAQISPTSIGAALSLSTSDPNSATRVAAFVNSILNAAATFASLNAETNIGAHNGQTAQAFVPIETGTLQSYWAALLKWRQRFRPIP